MRKSISFSIRLGEITVNELKTIQNILDLENKTDTIQKCIQIAYNNVIYFYTLEMFKPEKIQKCPICNKETNLISHHINGCRQNNLKENLIEICYRCNFEIHSSPILLKFPIEQRIMKYKELIGNGTNTT
jgi:hypothetical protein